ncbi:hypothetical protein CSC17_5846 [Klebsiella oxytoca]|nr:hypothetical protein CSC17_5846 [Klebsiella oxytoca]
MVSISALLNASTHWQSTSFGFIYFNSSVCDNFYFNLQYKKI